MLEFRQYEMSFLSSKVDKELNRREKKKKPLLDVSLHIDQNFDMLSKLMLSYFQSDLDVGYKRGN